MIKLKNFLNEAARKSNELNRVKNLIIADCKPFIEEVRRSKIPNFLYRGHESVIKDITKRTRRTNRWPKNSSVYFHELFDDLFYKKFKFRARSKGVFCSGSYSEASMYGDPYLFFPIGKYSYIYNTNIDDLYDYENMGEITDPYDPDIYNYDEYNEYDDEDKLTPEKVDSNNRELAKKLVDGYENKNIRKAITSKVEITFDVDSYYLVDSYYDDDLYKIFILSKDPFDTNDVNQLKLPFK